VNLKVAVSQPVARAGLLAPRHPGARPPGPSCHGGQGHPRPAYSRCRAPVPVGAPSYHRGMSAPASPGPASAVPWDVLRARARAATMGLPAVPGPGPGVCACCHGRARPGFAWCFHCRLHAESAPGLLADVVAPVACAPKGSRLATDLWVYKSGRPGAREAGGTLLAMLLVFLRDKGPGVWQRAGMPVPARACVVPSGRGRPGPHPLQALVRGCLALPWVPLLARPGADTWGRASRGTQGTGSGPVLRAAPAHRPGSAAPGRHLDLRWHRAVSRGGPQARRRPVGGGGRDRPPPRAPPPRPAGQ